MIFPIRSTSSLLKIPRYALTSLLINCCRQSQRHVDLNSRHLEGRLGVPLQSNDVHTFVQTCVLVVYCRSGTVLGTRRTMGKKRRLLSTVGCWMLMANHNRFLLQPHLNLHSPERNTFSLEIRIGKKNHSCILLLVRLPSRKMGTY